MARSLFYKEKVALSTLLVFCSICIAQAQSQFNNITYSCRSTRLETVIDFLSKKTGYDFIYSRSIVDVSKPVSISVKDKSINEILSLIEQQADVSFKLQDRHIVVKNSPKPTAAPTEKSIAKRIVKQDGLSLLELNDGQLMTSTRHIFPLHSIESNTRVLENNLDKHINEVQGLLGPNVPRNISPYYVSQINLNNRHKNWFVAAGAYVGDGSTGVELQAGLPYVYAVFHPTWSAHKGFNPSYGVGNSIALNGNFSFNTIYMYSMYSKTESVYPFTGPRGQPGPEFRRTESQHQHQVKLLIQYSITKTLSVRVGPVLNLRNVQNRYSILSASPAPEMGMYHQYEATTNSGVSMVYQNGKLISASKSDHYVESWIGWDASIIYRVNFYERK